MSEPKPPQPETSHEGGPDKRTFSMEPIEIGIIVRSLLESSDDFTKVKSFGVEYSNRELKINTTISVGEASDSNISVNATLKNEGGAVTVKNCSITANQATRKAKEKLIRSKINQIPETVRSHIEKEENKKVQKMEIKDGGLEVTFETSQATLTEKAATETQTPAAKVEAKNEIKTFPVTFMEDTLRPILASIERVTQVAICQFQGNEDNGITLTMQLKTSHGDFGDFSAQIDFENRDGVIVLVDKTVAVSAGTPMLQGLAKGTIEPIIRGALETLKGAIEKVEGKRVIKMKIENDANSGLEVTLDSMTLEEREDEERKKEVEKNVAIIQRLESEENYEEAARHRKEDPEASRQADPIPDETMDFLIPKTVELHGERSAAVGMVKKLRLLAGVRTALMEGNIAEARRLNQESTRVNVKGNPGSEPKQRYRDERAKLGRGIDNFTKIVEGTVINFGEKNYTVVELPSTETGGKYKIQGEKASYSRTTEEILTALEEEKATILPPEDVVTKATEKTRQRVGQEPNAEDGRERARSFTLEQIRTNDRIVIGNARYEVMKIPGRDGGNFLIRRFGSIKKGGKEENSITPEDMRNMINDPRVTLTSSEGASRVPVGPRAPRPADPSNPSGSGAEQQTEQEAAIVRLRRDIAADEAETRPKIAELRAEIERKMQAAAQEK